MVVKNKKKSMKQCLNAEKDKIDYWILVDSGFSDRTIRIAQQILAGVPGELYQSSNHAPQQKALLLAQGKADYLLTVDPRQELFVAPNFTLPTLDQDF